MNILHNVKALLGLKGTDKDAILSLLVLMAEQEAKAYCHRDNTDGMEAVITQMVVYKYNRLGTEGLTSESYSGASYSYESDYPQSILRQLNRFRKLVTL